MKLFRPESFLVWFYAACLVLFLAWVATWPVDG